MSDELVRMTITVRAAVHKRLRELAELSVPDKGVTVEDAVSALVDAALFDAKSGRLVAFPFDRLSMAPRILLTADSSRPMRPKGAKADPVSRDEAWQSEQSYSPPVGGACPTCGRPAGFHAPHCAELAAIEEDLLDVFEPEDDDD